MKRIRIQKPRVRWERPWLDVLSLDPRDPDVVRAKGASPAGERLSQPGRVRTA